MHTSIHHLERHFSLPKVRTVETGRPLRWLAAGWNDLLDNLTVSLTYGAAISILGYLILAFAAGEPYLITAAVSGFFLVGPVVAAGLYEISRRHSRGETVNLANSYEGLTRHAGDLFYFGLFLVLALVAWERLSAILFALFYRGDIADIGQLMSTVLYSGEYLVFTFTYLVVGGVLAALVFTLSVVSIPMLMDRETDIFTAMMTSARAVSRNLSAMAFWALLIVILVGIGFATMMIAMIVMLPLLGHASWYAYKDLIE